MRRFTPYVLAFVLFSFPCAAKADNRILATVNDEAISSLDLQQRKTLTRLLSKDKTLLKDKNADKKMLDQLIDEKLKIQEAKRQGVGLSSQEIDKIIAEAVRQNGYSLEELKALLKKNGVDFSVVENMIKSDFLFLRAVRKQAGQRADISESEINTRYKELEDALKTKQYFLSEIVVPVKDEKDDPFAYGRAMQALIDLKDGKRLEDVVAQYSTADSVSKGGVIGWTAENKLPKEIRDELELMRAGEVSTPVKTGNAYKIFILHNVQNPSDLKNQTAYKLSQIFVPSNTKNKAGLVKKIKKTNGSCDKFVTLAIQENQTPRVDLGVLTTAELPEPVLQKIQKAGILKVTDPMAIESGDLYFMACEKTTSSVLPSKEQIRMQLENARIDVLAQRRLRDLKRTAVMDMR